MKNNPPKNNPSRRGFIKKAAYVAPLVLTLKATPAYAARGSGGCGGNGGHHGGGHHGGGHHGGGHHGGGSNGGSSSGGNSGGSRWFSRVVVFFTGL